MTRRPFLSALIAVASFGALRRKLIGADPQNPVTPARIPGSGKPLASTVDAVRSVESKPLGEMRGEVAEYFQWYGRRWAPSGNWTADAAADYTRFLQRAARLPVTGTLTVDSAASILSRPRCGVPDRPPGTAALAASKWAFTDLTYWVDPNHGTNLRADQWRNVLREAWDQWAAVSPVRCQPSSGATGASCLHSFGAGSTAGFDGPGGVLAWAELPPTFRFTGQLLNRYDRGETWTDATTPGAIRALNVATHEIGHLLGLDHSNDPSALMAPFYDPAVSAPQPDDIRRIRALYPSAVPGGPGGGGPGPVDPTPPPPPVDPTDPTDPPTCPPRGGPRFFPGRPRLFPRRRRIC